VFITEEQRAHEYITEDKGGATWKEIDEVGGWLGWLEKRMCWPGWYAFLSHHLVNPLDSTVFSILSI
jgi:hypothetical protein